MCLSLQGLYGWVSLQLRETVPSRKTDCHVLSDLQISAVSEVKWKFLSIGSVKTQTDKRGKN